MAAELQGAPMVRLALLVVAALGSSRGELSCLTGDNERRSYGTVASFFHDIRMMALGKGFKLASSNWASHRISTEVARILLEEFLY